MDLRFGSPKERDRVLTALEEIAPKQYVPDTTTELEIREFMAAFDSSSGVQELADFVAETSRDYDFGDMGTVFLGGGSDARLYSAGGNPCNLFHWRSWPVQPLRSGVCPCGKHV